MMNQESRKTGKRVEAEELSFPFLLSSFPDSKPAPPDYEHMARMVAFAETSACRKRDIALSQVEQNAGEDFMARALEFVPKYLATHGPTSGEIITDSCKAAGIKPENTDKAFGAVYQKLSRGGVIEKAGFCQRLKGNATAGGIVWRVRAGLAA